MDIATITRPRTVVLPILGDVALDIASSLLTDWLRTGLLGAAWDDPNRFVRDLLIERGTVAPVDSGKSDPEALPMGVVEGLSGLEIEVVSAAMLPTVLPYLRNSNESLAETPPGESCQRLLDAAKAHVERHDRLEAEHAERQRKSMRSFSELDELSSLYSRSITEVLRTEDALSKAARAARDAAALQSAAAGMLGAVRATDAVTTATDMIASLGGMNAFDAAARGVAGRGTITDVYARVQQEARAASRHSSDLEWMTGGVTDLVAQQLAWARHVDHALALGREMDRLTASTAWTDPISTLFAGMHRTGFRSVAELAMLGQVGAGAASDILRGYDVSRAAYGELFASVLVTVQSLDDDEVEEEERADLVHSVASVLRRPPPHERRRHERRGAYDISMLVFTMLGAAFGGAALMTTSDMPQLRDASKDLKEAALLLREERKVEMRGSRTRYLHRPTALHAAPEPGAPTIRVAFPDQMIEVMDVRGEWARIEVYDYTSDRPAEGWVVRRRLHLAPD